MARRTISQCDKEIATLKLQVSTLEQELVRRTNYAVEVDQELARLREELDQHPDETPDHVLIQARMHKDTVAVVTDLQKQLGAANRTEVLVRGVQLLLKEQSTLRSRVARRVRTLLSLSTALLFLGCASNAIVVKPLSYPWQCEQDPKVKSCTLIGYTVNSSNQYIAEMYGDAVCDEVKSVTTNAKTDESLVLCK